MYRGNNCTVFIFAYQFSNAIETWLSCCCVHRGSILGYVGVIPFLQVLWDGEPISGPSLNICSLALATFGLVSKLFVFSVYRIPFDSMDGGEHAARDAQNKPLVSLKKLMVTLTSCAQLFKVIPWIIYTIFLRVLWWVIRSNVCYFNLSTVSCSTVLTSLWLLVLSEAWSWCLLLWVVSLLHFRVSILGGFWILWV